MIYATCLIMFILSKKTITFSDFPVNIWVASFIVYGFHRSTFFQSGICLDIHLLTCIGGKKYVTVIRI